MQAAETLADCRAHLRRQDRSLLTHVMPILVLAPSLNMAWHLRERGLSASFACQLGHEVHPQESKAGYEGLRHAHSFCIQLQPVCMPQHQGEVLRAWLI